MEELRLYYAKPVLNTNNDHRLDEIALLSRAAEKTGVSFNKDAKELLTSVAETFPSDVIEQIPSNLFTDTPTLVAQNKADLDRLSKELEEVFTVPGKVNEYNDSVVPLTLNQRTEKVAQDLFIQLQEAVKEPVIIHDVCQKNYKDIRTECGDPISMNYLAMLSTQCGVQRVYLAENFDTNNASVTYETPDDYSKVFIAPKTVEVDSDSVRAEIVESPEGENYQYARLMAASKLVMSFDEKGAMTGVEQKTQDTQVDTIKKTCQLLTKTNRSAEEEKAVMAFAAEVEKEAERIILSMRSKGMEMPVPMELGDKYNQMEYARTEGIVTIAGSVDKENAMQGMVANNAIQARKELVPIRGKQIAADLARQRELERIRLELQKLEEKKQKDKEDEEKRKRLEEEQKAKEEEMQKKEQAAIALITNCILAQMIGHAYAEEKAGKAYVTKLAQMQSVDEISKEMATIEGEVATINEIGKTEQGRDNRDYSRNSKGNDHEEI